MNRRSFVALGVLGTLGATIDSAPTEAAQDFSFVHFTDIHIQPELH